ncbi:MAG: RNA-binding S4 domain-containing protein [Solobacterium sp.]|nr:RNA-binding S4 domain-containing protein [Erysipelotrichaceae bacterium]MBQ1325530.1 RNA-binding S4 domain-containing protein [Solobacterium sp.]MBQ1446541.1 RNA-binding S4 domain-containing protein [Solobacterium sp.]MBQ2690321.1 RNA-binding S4 domain-containing protein [Solobacterium sp.]MBQ6592306.1 RNA-binding S4 domain-containing protein [Solobacterium sp.]
MNSSEKAYITLSQFLKKTGIAATGGQAKYLVKELDITVNGEKEDRRGKKLYSGDEVIIDGRKYIVE